MLVRCRRPGECSSLPHHTDCLALPKRHLFQNIEDRGRDLNLQLELDHLELLETRAISRRINGQNLHQTIFPYLHLHRSHPRTTSEKDGSSQRCAEPRRIALPQRSRFVVRDTKGFSDEASILHSRKFFTWIVATYSRSCRAVRSLDQLEKQQHHLNLQLPPYLATKQAPAREFMVVRAIGWYTWELVAWCSSEEMLMLTFICTAKTKEQGTSDELKKPGR